MPFLLLLPPYADLDMAYSDFLCSIGYLHFFNKSHIQIFPLSDWFCTYFEISKTGTMDGLTILQSTVYAYHIDLSLCKSISYRLFCLSSPPSSLSLSLRSDSPAFLTFPLRMLEIPSGCGLDDWLLLFQFQKCIYFSHFGPMHYSALWKITKDSQLTSDWPLLWTLFTIPILKPIT